MEVCTLKTPVEGFMIWFETVPLTLQGYFAHIFRVCTTDDTSQMVSHPNESLDWFKNWATKKDFSLRISARTFYIQSVFDMILIFHYKGIVLGEDFNDLIFNKKAVSCITVREWARLFESWKELRNNEMSDYMLYNWALSINKHT